MNTQPGGYEKFIIIIDFAMARSATYNLDVYQPRNPKASAYYKCVEKDEDRHSYGRELLAIEKEVRAWIYDSQRNDGYTDGWEDVRIKEGEPDPQKRFLHITQCLEKGTE